MGRCELWCSGTVQDQLKNVQQIQASDSAFAAIPGDGSVVTWGMAHCGGDSISVHDQLKKTFNRSNPHGERLLPSWEMGLLSHGVTIPWW